jgi:MFS family permease
MMVVRRDHERGAIPTSAPSQYDYTPDDRLDTHQLSYVAVRDASSVRRALIAVDTLVYNMINISNVDQTAQRPEPSSPHPAARWLVAGEVAVMLVSQMWFVTLSWWLVSSRGAGTAVGGILAVGAIPRAAFMLIGGAASDRFSPAAVLRSTAIARMVVLGASVLVATGSSPTWQLYLISAGFGVVDGFGFPAVTATLPLIASGAGLARLNAYVQMSDQVTQIVGPASAAALLAQYGTRSSLLFASCFAVIALFAFAQLARRVQRRSKPTPGSSMGREIADGLRYTWKRPDLRAYLLVVGGLGLGTVGPMTLGSALLAKERFNGASSLGWLLGAFGVGAFLGTVIAGLRLPRVSPKQLLVGLCAVVAVGMGGLAVAPSLPVAVAIATVTAMSWGYEGVVTATWLQSTTDPAYQGRVSSLLAFSFLALDPVSQALTGSLSSYGPGMGFGVGAGIVAIIGLIVLATPWPEAPSTSTAPTTST